MLIRKKGISIRTSTFAQHNMHFIYNQSHTNLLTHLFDGALEFVHVAFKKREMGEKEILEAIVLLSVWRQHEDDPNGDLLLPCHTEAWSAAFIRHVEALLHWPDGDKVNRPDVMPQRWNVCAAADHEWSYLSIQKVYIFYCCLDFKYLI